jgi:DNA polymerase-1
MKINVQAGPTARERIFLLDGMALAYRAYFSFINRPLINSRGENTSAIYGFITTLMKILQEEKPEHIAVVFDTKEPTFRHIMYDAYKATRQKMPEDLASQLDMLKEVVRGFNVPSIELPGYEADDIMGTLARRAEREKMETFLVTGDKDFMQLISPLIKMYKPGKRGDEWEILDETAVMKKFGVDPAHVIDVLAIIGDASDNIPGVHGIGEKTAIPLVRQFGTLENLYNNLENISQQGTRHKLEQQRDQAFLSKKLVTIDTNVPLEIDLHHLSAKPHNTQILGELFTRLEFKGLMKKLLAAVDASVTPAADEFPPPTAPTTNILNDKHTYHLIQTNQELDKLSRILSKADEISFDTETTGVDPLRAELVGIAVAVAPREAWYIPVRSAVPDTTPQVIEHPADLFSSENSTHSVARDEAPVRDEGTKEWRGLPASIVLKSLGPVLTNPTIGKTGQNIKYDMLVMAMHGIFVKGVTFDTMIASYLIRPDGQHNLDGLAREHLQYEMISYDTLTGTGKQRKELRDIPVREVADYSAQDADITLRLCKVLRAKLETEGMRDLYEKVELPLVPVLTEMEFAGVALNTAFLAHLSQELEQTLGKLIESIYALAGEQFNINSTQQLSTILFEKLKLPVVRKTKTGFSTDVGVLETLRHTHPMIEQLLEYRQLQKLKSTYVDALPALLHPRTGRLHTSYNQAVTSTGRLSSSDPNLQNIPIRTDIGQRIRQAFVPGSKNNLILSADYSQIELRIMAHISGDEGLREAFLRGEDIHTTTAAKVFNVSAAEVTKDMRRKAKEINFGIMYGIGPYGLSTRLDISQTEAKEVIAKYFERFPKVNQYIADTIATARETGFVSTLLGRRRYFPDIGSKNFSIRSNAERQAINMPIQGTAADMIKVAMINIHAGLPKVKIDALMLLQVHDELVFEVPARQAEKAKSFIVEQMKNALPLSVPVEVDAGIGKSWLEAH